jgi:hypothetical protein
MPEPATEALTIRVAPSARARPLSIARAQAYEAAARLAGWRVQPLDLETPVREGLGNDITDAAVLIGATASEISDWLSAGHGVIADGNWSEDPDEVDEVARIAHQNRQPLVHGDELLHAPVFAGALTEAAEIGQLSSFETRGLHPFNSHTERNVITSLAPPVLMRALLSMRILDNTTQITWDSALITDQGGSGTTATWRGGVFNSAGVRTTRLSVVVGSHRGRSTIHDLQMSSSSGVVRAELMPTPSIESNGEPVLIPPATHSPAQLEWFGMISMLSLLRRAVVQRVQPLTGVGLFAEALRLSAWASAGGGGPFR